MSRFLSLILLLACLALIAWFLPSVRTPNHNVGAFPAGVAAAEEESAFRILFGVTDRESAKWDGSLAVSAGAIARIEPWRFDEDDKIEESSGATARWKASTRQGRAFGAQPQRPVVANGVILTLRNLTSASEVSVETTQGKFSFRPDELPYGKTVKLLDGRVMVDRVTAGARIAGSRDEQDYPTAATDREGNVWVACAQFTPNPKFTGIRWSGAGGTKNFAELAEPTGGDQIMLMKWSRGAWSEAVAVTEKGGDLYKPAVDVDDLGRVWVFWSANNGANFDLYARSFEAGKGGKTVRLTSDRGPDIAPVAATDAKGRVWVVWQGFRNGRSQIRAAYQQGDKFSDEILVASSISNEWNPAIAAPDVYSHINDFDRRLYHDFDPALLVERRAAVSGVFLSRPADLRFSDFRDAAHFRRALHRRAYSRWAVRRGDFSRADHRDVHFACVGSGRWQSPLLCRARRVRFVGDQGGEGRGVVYVAASDALKQ